MEIELDFLDENGFACDVSQTGSSYICNPPVNTTDKDFLVLLENKDFETLYPIMIANGWVMDKGGDYPEDEDFNSFRKGDVNLIMTFNVPFANRFIAATEVAKKLNLLDKNDRIMLFQAVLYANAPDQF